MTTPATPESVTSNGASPQRRTSSQKPSDTTSQAEPVARLRAGAATAGEAVTRLRETADTVAQRLPDAVAAARVTALDTADSFKGLPEPTRRSLAALSIGLGIGLSLAGAPRLLTMAALTPALLSALAMTAEDGRRSRTAAT